MVLMAATIFILFFAQSVEMLLVGNIFCGIPWGIFQTLTTAYAAEICPAALRGYLTAWVSMCWGAGSFLATGVLRATIDDVSDFGWQLPYGLQWIWIPPLLIVAWFAPESPWYLIRRGKVAEAEKNLYRLARPGHYTEQTMRETLALMKHTDDMEKMEAKNASYADCFRGENKRRTMIVCMAWVIQIFNGQSITNYAAQMLRAIGMSAEDAFNYNMGIQSVNILATAVAIALMGSVGRRTFYLFGSSGIGFCMLVIGIMGFAAKEATDVAIPVAVFLIFVQIAFKVSLGPTTYVIVGETASSRVRAQTIVLGRALYVCGQIAVQQLNPRMLNNDPTAWNWGAKTGMFYFGFCLLWVVWIFFFLPETKERTFAEIDYLFKKKTPARKFRTTPVDRKFCPQGWLMVLGTNSSAQFSSSFTMTGPRRSWLVWRSRWNRLTITPLLSSGSRRAITIAVLDTVSLSMLSSTHQLNSTCHCIIRRLHQFKSARECVTLHRGYNRTATTGTLLPRQNVPRNYSQ